MRMVEFCVDSHRDYLTYCFIPSHVSLSLGATYVMRRSLREDVPDEFRPWRLAAACSEDIGTPASADA